MKCMAKDLELSKTLQGFFLKAAKIMELTNTKDAWYERVHECCLRRNTETLTAKTY